MFKQSEFWPVLVWRTGQRLLSPCQLGNGMFCSRCAFKCKAPFGCKIILASPSCHWASRFRSITFQMAGPPSCPHNLGPEFIKPNRPVPRTHTCPWHSFAPYLSTRTDYKEKPIRKTLRKTHTMLASLFILLFYWKESAYIWRQMTVLREDSINKS